MTAPVLQLEKATLRFGGLTAVNAVDLSLGTNELVGLIGPNGAGKTTVFNLITGIYAPSSGRVIFQGRDLAGLPVNRRVRAGIARTFQNIRLFKDLTALDNVRVACHQGARAGWAAALLRSAGFLVDEIGRAHV